MRKKSKFPAKPKNIVYYLKRFFLSSVVALVVATVAFILFPSHQSSFCANSISCIKDLSAKVDNSSTGVFEGRKILAPAILLAQADNTAVLGASVTPGEKHIYADLPTQTLYAYQGKTLVMKTLISSGKWHPTPDGDFTIWVKLRLTRMTGGSGDDYYDLPNVPYVMFFANDQVPRSEGFSLHGAYWHNNFGHPMSHGCVNMRITDAEALYNWADPVTTGLTTYATATDPGTKVTIIGSAPGVTTH